MPKRRPPRHRRSFKPGAKGDVSSALQSRKELDRVAPSSPRPVAFLEAMRIEGDVTALDAALWESLVSIARERGLDLEQHSIAIGQAMTVMGPHAKLANLEKSIKRLRKADISFDLRNARGSREHGAVPMLIGHFLEESGGQILFTVPEPVRRLMLKPGRYAHLEIGALARMDSRYGAPLYRFLLTKVRDRKPGEPVDGLVTAWSMTSEDLADAIGYTSANKRFDFKAFNRRALVPAMLDLLHVRRFRSEVELVRGAGRGRPVERIDIKLTTTAADWREMKSRLLPKHVEKVTRLDDDGQFYVEERKVTSWQMSAALKPALGREVDARVFLRAAENLSLFKGQLNCYTVEPVSMRQAWLIALYESDLGQALAPGYDGREYRGNRLLEAIAREGASNACWGFLQEEKASPVMLSRGPEIYSKIQRWIEQVDGEPTPVPAEVVHAIVTRPETFASFDVVLDAAQITPTAEEQRLLDQVETTAQRGAMTTSEQKALRTKLSENALASRIKAVQAYLSALRIPHQDGGALVRIVFPHRGQNRKFDMVTGYRLTSEHLSALRAMDGVGAVTER